MFIQGHAQKKEKENLQTTFLEVKNWLLKQNQTAGACANITERSFV